MENNGFGQKKCFVIFFFNLLCKLQIFGMCVLFQLANALLDLRFLKGIDIL